MTTRFPAPLSFESLLRLEWSHSFSQCFLASGLVQAFNLHQQWDQWWLKNCATDTQWDCLHAFGLTSLSHCLFWFNICAFILTTLVDFSCPADERRMTILCFFSAACCKISMDFYFCGHFYFLPHFPRKFYWKPLGIVTFKKQRRWWPRSSRTFSQTLQCRHEWNSGRIMSQVLSWCTAQTFNTLPTLPLCFKKVLSFWVSI